MPFTPAHPAIVLPFIRKNYCSATALIAGSMAPDFEYFFKMSVEGSHGHTIAGLFYFDIPVVIIISFLFHQVVKRNLILNLPVFLQKRFAEALHFNFIPYVKRKPAIFLLSGLAGSASHIFWDSFTHGNGYFAVTLPFYKGTYIPFDGVNYPLFYALQHISTAIGLLCVVLYIILEKPEETIKPSKPQPLYWILFIVIAAIIVLLRFAIRNDDYNLGNVVVCTISGMILSVIILGFTPFRKIQKV